MNRSTPGLPVHHQLLEFTQTRVHRVSDAIQPSHPLSSPSPPAPNPSQHQSFSNESTLCMRWPKYWSFSLSIIPSKEIPGLISFRMDRLDLLAVQGTLKSLLQHHTFQIHQFFGAQPSSQSNSHIHTWPQGITDFWSSQSFAIGLAKKFVQIFSIRTFWTNPILPCQCRKLTLYIHSCLCLLSQIISDIPMCPFMCVCHLECGVLHRPLTES